MSVWKKRKEIEGVSSASIVELKSILFQQEQDVKNRIENPEKKSKKLKNIIQNPGVDERNKRDIDQQQEEEKSFDKVEEKLKQKVELYKQMVKGEYDLDDEKYLVDFERKGWESGETPSESTSTNYNSNYNYSESTSTYKNEPSNDEEDNYSKYYFNYSSNTSTGYTNTYHNSNTTPAYSTNTNTNTNTTKPNKPPPPQPKANAANKQKRYNFNDYNYNDTATPVEETRKLWEKEAKEGKEDHPISSKVYDDDSDEADTEKRRRKMRILGEVVDEVAEGREKLQANKDKRKQALAERMKMIKERKGKNYLQ